MKKALSMILCAVFCILILAACSESDNTADVTETNITEHEHMLAVLDKADRDTLTATFSSTETGETMETELKMQTSADNDVAVYGCYADPALYDRVVITYGKQKTEELAFNEYVTGYDLTSGRVYPYNLPAVTEPEYERKTFDYEERTKDVLIWTPETYDASAEEKYSVIYMTDGQNIFDRKATATGSWGVAESALAMAANGGEKCIIVGVETSGITRDMELTPDIGEVLSEGYEDGRGEYFSDFVVDTVMPYINENYNVYADREHTHVCGSSSGGIESFYIAMEHPDRFASVGALSPAFILYDDATWKAYLQEKDFSENAPLVYLYCGNSAGDALEQTLYTGTVSMPDNLASVGYPAEQVVTKLYDGGVHNEMYWRAVFPDYLKYAFPKAEAAE